jgi:transcription antitermination factor NusG
MPVRLAFIRAFEVRSGQFMAANGYRDVSSKLLSIPFQEACDSWNAPLLRFESPAWFAIHVRSQCEVLAARELAARGYTGFLPTRRVKRRWSDRTKMVQVPVFPGYIFSRFDLSHRFRVLNLPGVARIVGSGATPIPISDIEIDSVRAMVASKAAFLPWPYLRVGQRVRLQQGPLAGVEGIVAEAPDGRSRIVVSIDLLQRSLATEIEREWIGAVN